MFLAFFEVCNIYFAENFQIFISLAMKLPAKGTQCFAYLISMICVFLGQEKIMSKIFERHEQYHD
jgi:hypothetical protein